MNVKKSIAAIASIAMLCASVVTTAAIENAGTDSTAAVQAEDGLQEQSEDTNSTDGTDTGNNDVTTPDGAVPTEEQGIINEEQYAALTAEQKAKFYKVTVGEGVSAIINGTDCEFSLPSLSYVQKDTFEWILISVRYDIYDKVDVLINGEKATLKPNGNNSAYNMEYGVEDYQLDELSIETKVHSDAKGIIDEAEYATLTDEQKANFIKMNIAPDIYVSYKYGDYTQFFTDGYYINKNSWDNIYVCVMPDVYAGYNIMVNGEIFNASGEITNGENYGGSINVSNYAGNELNFVLSEVSGMANADEYAAMPEARKNGYIKLNIDENAFISMQDKITDETIDLSDGIYVAKIMDYIYIGVYPDIYENNDVYVNGEKYDVELSGDGYSNYGKAYYIGNYSGKELTVTLGEKQQTAAAENTSVSNTVVPTVKTDTAAEKKIINTIVKSNKPNLAVDVSETGVTAEMLSNLANNKKVKTLTAKYGSGFMINIAKEYIDAENAETLDFSVSGNNFISRSQIAKNKVLRNSERIIQLDFNKKGELTGVDKVTVKTRTNIGDDGKTAVIYELVDGKLKKAGKYTIKARGFVEFETDHLGQFVIVVQ